MKLLRHLSTVVSPARSSFAKRLTRKRVSIAEEALFATASVGGTVQDWLRNFGLESIDHAFSPDSVVANALYIYRYRYLQSFYGSLSEAVRVQMEADDPKSWNKRLNSFVPSIDMHLTGHGDASLRIPAFSTFPEYLLFAAKRAFPSHPYITPVHGFTGEYFSYAIDESALAFG